MSTAPAAFVVAPATPEDIDGLCEIEAASNPRPWSADAFVGELTRPQGWLRVVRSPPQRGFQTAPPVSASMAPSPALGFVCAWFVVDEVHLLNLAVAPQHRRLGLARCLVEDLVSEARRRSARVVSLEVRRANAGARDLYRALGFREVGVRPGYYPDERGGGGDDAVLLDLVP